MPDQTITPQSLPQREDLPIEEPFTINEIIGQAPGWILHSGMTVLFIVVAIGFAMTFIIQYPDRIQAIGVITTVDPYKPIVTKSSGIVDTVFIENNKLVSKQTPVLYIQNTADRKDVIKCMEQIERLEKMMMTLKFTGIWSNSKRKRSENNFIESTSWNANFTLGPMQSTFASLNQQVLEYQHYLSRGDYALKLEAIGHEIEEVQYLNEVLEKEKELTKEEVALSNIDMERNRELFAHGIISEREMERSQARHIGMQKSYILKGNNIAQNRIRIAGLRQQKIDILAARNEQHLLYQSRISEIILNLTNQYRQWSLQYYIHAPDDGRIQLSSDVVAGQTVPTGKPIGYIIPESVDSKERIINSKYAKVYVPANGVGKIKTGNPAIIHIEAYPYKEYGTINSWVEDVYPVPELKDNGTRIYELHLPLDSLLTTDYGHPIQYTPEMPIQVTIIAKERSLFERIFDQFLNLVKTHSPASHTIQTNKHESNRSNLQIAAN